jgi:glycosyltransferase involved in cell wall biosynthesis
MAHVVIVGNEPKSLCNFRGDLIRAIVSSGHEVTAMSAPANAQQMQQIEALGASFRSFPVQRSGLTPWRDIQTFLSLRKAFRKLKPDLVLAYTIKPVIWSGLAARGISDISFFALITGLGFAFQGRSIARNILTWGVSWLYQASLQGATGVIFQNADNRNEFIARQIIPESHCFVVAGSGVDVLHFKATDLPESAPVFLCIARLLGEKGLREYAQAAYIVKHRYPDAIFYLLGPTDPSPDGIQPDEVQRWQDQGTIEYLGETCDVRPFIAACHVYVLPSYHEGMPRSVLEAMSIGRPILTTDASGCRETVRLGANGFLVPVRDVHALAERMIWFIEHRDQWQLMGQASRRIAKERFDVRKINAELLSIMKLDGARA